MQVQSSIGKKADLVYLNAIMAQRKHKPAFEVLALLQETVEVHFSAVKVSILVQDTSIYMFMLVTVV